MTMNMRRANIPADCHNVGRTARNYESERKKLVGGACAGRAGACTAMPQRWASVGTHGG